ncbi:hypothetical protein TIFTF001_012649 [Ficus carica]|uniref:Uncharacterized protein n=1 Tax=Ficus carica TaxID=3494 RepID=A0AA88DI42_FICCA|nr:hypothetical protein TIFTF001_012649 [Ficus carica]
MNLGELNTLPKNMFTIAEAMTAFMRILGFVKESLRKVRLRGEFDEYPNEKCMHCTARLVNGIASIPIAFVERLWHYIGEVVIAVLMSHVENYYQLQLSARRTSHNLIAKMKDRSKGGFLHDESKPSRMHLDGFGDVDVEHLRQYPHFLHQAFDFQDKDDCLLEDCAAKAG